MFVGINDQLGPSLFEVTFDPIEGPLANRYDTVFLSFALSDWKWQSKREPVWQPKREFWQSEREPLGAIIFIFLMNC